MSLLKHSQRVQEKDPTIAGLAVENLPASSTTGLPETAHQHIADNLRGLPVRKSKATQYTPEERAKIGKFANENRNSQSLKHFKEEFPNLKESTLRNFKRKYQEMLSSNDTVTEIPTAKRGRPTTLPESIDKDMIRYITSLKEAGGVINTQVLNGVVKALLMDKSGQYDHMMTFEATRGWRQSLYRRMGLPTKQVSTSTSRPPGSQLPHSADSMADPVPPAIKTLVVPNELILDVTLDKTSSKFVKVNKKEDDVSVANL